MPNDGKLTDEELTKDYKYPALVNTKRLRSIIKAAVKAREDYLAGQEGGMSEKIAMNIVDWFDPHNKAHLEAYCELEKNGAWPKGFLPENILLPPMWNVLIAFKLADRYISERLAQRHD